MTVRRLLWPTVVFCMAVCLRFEEFVLRETMSAKHACDDDRHRDVPPHNNRNNQRPSSTSSPLAPSLQFFRHLFAGGGDEPATTHHVASPYFFDAMDVNGQDGYIADPLALRRGVKAFLAAEASKQERIQNYIRQHQHELQELQLEVQVASSSSYFHVLQHYPTRRHYHRNNVTTTLAQDLQAAKDHFAMNRICSVPGGQGEWEGPSGFKLLKEKIQLVNNPAKSPRVLCLMYTHDHKRDLARASALSWGVHCDGFLAMTTETIPALGMVHLVHPGQEEYLNMWQKIRSIWAYAGMHYLYDYDYFHISGDDVFLMVDNLKHFLQTRFEQDKSSNNKNNKDVPIITGAHAVIWPDIDNIDYLIGGPGYTMNRAALKLFVSKGLDPVTGCAPGDRKAEEDQIISKCFQQTLGVGITESRDPVTGEQLYHHQAADRVYNDSAKDNDSMVYMFRVKRYWSQQPHPSAKSANDAQTVGHLDGLDAAHQHSVAFHFLRNPSDMARYTAIVHRLCPPQTPLAQSLLTTTTNSSTS